jgi:hypothetical protein
MTFRLSVALVIGFLGHAQLVRADQDIEPMEGTTETPQTGEGAAIDLPVHSKPAAFVPYNLKINAFGWISWGIVGNSSDTAAGDRLTNKPVQSFGAAVTLSGGVTEDLFLTAGMGVGAGHTLNGRLTNNGGYSPLQTGPFVTQASAEYSFIQADESKMSLKVGYFPYSYAQESQNLGSYLLRGPVYPGYLISGFELKPTYIAGLQFHQNIGGFFYDVFVNSETELYPYFDLSPAAVVGYNMGKTFRVNAGVNFYHYISIDDQLTSHTNAQWEEQANRPFDRNWIYVDSVAKISETEWKLDTTYLTFKGIKVMVNAMVDLKQVLGVGDLWGEEDLKLYGEVALIGLDQSKAYNALYGKLSNRMPLMVGFNVPTFGLLDRLSLEVESYKAKFRDDLTRFMPTTGKKQSPIPRAWPSDPDPNAITDDDLKWSVYAAKTVAGHLKFSMQVANDHFRPGVFEGYGDNNWPRMEAVLFSMKDWYFMSKVAYFF